MKRFLLLLLSDLSLPLSNFLKYFYVYTFNYFFRSHAMNVSRRRIILKEAGLSECLARLPP